MKDMCIGPHSKNISRLNQPCSVGCFFSQPVHSARLKYNWTDLFGLCLHLYMLRMCLFACDIVKQAFLQAIISYFKGKATVRES